jgi:hypothetical protein
MGVREFTKSDIPQAVNLYWNHLAPRSGTPPSELHAAFADLYFSNPLSDGASPSFVYENREGEIVGFLGMTTRKMWMGEEVVRVGFGGNFVVHPKARSSMATPRILGAVMSGIWDILLTDSANDISKPVLERVGFTTVPGLNVHWSRPLRAWQYATYLLSRRINPVSAAALRIATKPFSSVLDSISGGGLNSVAPAKNLLDASELTANDLDRCLLEFGNHQKFRPQYNPASLQWLLNFMARNRKRGELCKVLLRDEAGGIAGWYIYYAKRGAVGEVVQIGGRQDTYQDILGHLFRHARDRGVVALHGQVDFAKMPDFSDAGCFFSCRGGWVLAHSRNPDLIKILQSGQVNLSRLDGEWCLHPGD